MKSSSDIDEPTQEEVATSGWKESFQSIILAILVALTLRAFVIEAFKIPSGSMIPTLAIGDQIFVNKYLYGVRIPFTATRLIEFADPARGDVIVFICPDKPSDDYIKRIVAVDGDTIEVRGGILHINGKEIQRKALGLQQFPERNERGWYPFEADAFEETIDDVTFTVLQAPRQDHPLDDFGPFLVPAGHVFVMGDNRDFSRDSRIFGPVPKENILGRSLFVWWSWGQHGLATERFGTWID